MGGKTSSASKKKYNDKTYAKYTVQSRKDVLTRDDIVEAAKAAGMPFDTFCTEAILAKIQQVTPQPKQNDT